jgi:23S rRNA (guanosine2251-2'-O)-methyltransferase
MNPKDLKALQHIHKMMLALEKRGSDPFLSPQDLPPIQEALQAFVTHQEHDFQKIAAIAPHLHPAMTLKQFSAWVVPVERLLQKELRDDEFLIYSEDGSLKAQPKLPLVLVLHNLRSAFNVGSIFRTAECFGVSKIYLCGYTPLPTQEKLAKTSMGTAHLIEWEEVAKFTELLKKLRAENCHVVGLETTSHAAPLQSPFAKAQTALVLGNERFGLDPEALSLCNEVRKIELRGQKNSLNVSVAAAIATYEFSRQWSPS